MDKYLDLTKEQFKAFMALPIDTPLQMLNLLKFKDKVEGTDISGRDQYKKYMTATQPFFEKSNAKVLFYGNAKFTLIGPQELEWDKVLIVEYPTKNDFINLVSRFKSSYFDSPGYVKYPFFPFIMCTDLLQQSVIIRFIFNDKFAKIEYRLVQEAFHN